MKRLITVAVLVLLAGTVAFTQRVVAKGSSLTAFGDYKIQLMDENVSMLGKECKSYLITYKDTPLEVSVIIYKDKKCKRFVTLSDKLSVAYVCNGQYFGVEKLGKSFEAEGYKTSDQTMDRYAYFHQKVITNGDGTDLENTQLIAAFFPMLVNQPNEGLATK